MPVAPYQAVIIPVNDRETELVNTAENLYTELIAAGVEVVLDNRQERAGVKFKDADLIGYPVRITVGAKALARGNVEVRLRQNGEMQEVAVAEVKSWLQDYIAAEIAKCSIN